NQYFEHGRAYPLSSKYLCDWSTEIRGLITAAVGAYWQTAINDAEATQGWDSASDSVKLRPRLGLIARRRDGYEHPKIVGCRARLRVSSKKNTGGDHKFFFFLSSP